MVYPEDFPVEKEVPIEDRICCVYKITCLVNNKLYIGITCNYKKRYFEHMNSPFRFTSKNATKLGAAIRKYGPENFKGEILIIGKRSYCAELEAKLVEEWSCRTDRGFNIREGGFNGAYSPTRGPDKSGKKRPLSSGAFKKGQSPSLKMTPNLIERLVIEYTKGSEINQMDWLPVTSQQAKNLLKERGIYQQRVSKTSVDIAQTIYDRYTTEKISQEDLAKELGVNRSIVKRCIQRIHPKEKGSIQRPASDLSFAEKIYEERLITNISVVGLAKKYNIPRSAVYSNLKAVAENRGENLPKVFKLGEETVSEFKQSGLSLAKFAKLKQVDRETLTNCLKRYGAKNASGS